jgi:hypothetical protein
MRLSRKRMIHSVAHSIQRDMHQTIVYSLDLRASQPCRIEMTRQELYEAEVRSNEVVSLMLPSDNHFSARWCKFLLDVEGIVVSRKMISSKP